MKVIARATAIFLLIVLLSSAAGVGFLYYLNRPVSTNATGDRLFSVHPGESLSSVEDRLASENFISHGLIFRVFSIMKPGSTIKAGTYRMENGKSAWEIFELLVSGRQVLTRVTVPEGWTASKIARLLEEKGICAADDFLRELSNPSLLSGFRVHGDSLEGFLFPETYYFPSGYPASEVVRHFAETFFDGLGELYPDYVKLTAEQLYRKVIIASIVEREYRIPEEAPLMASVFYNRLKARMPLGSCATVEYIVTELEKRPHPEYLSFQDLKIDSGYNTYIYKDLPPGPISNPGSTALKAAFFPASTEYLYFVLKDPEAGKHFFSKNLDEHNLAKRYYLKKY